MVLVGLWALSAHGPARTSPSMVAGALVAPARARTVDEVDRDREVHVAEQLLFALRADLEALVDASGRRLFSDAEVLDLLALAARGEL